MNTKGLPKQFVLDELKGLNKHLILMAHIENRLQSKFEYDFAESAFTPDIEEFKQGFKFLLGSLVSVSALLGVIPEDILPNHRNKLYEKILGDAGSINIDRLDSLRYQQDFQQIPVHNTRCGLCGETMWDTEYEDHLNTKHKDIKNEHSDPNRPEIPGE